MEFQVKVREGLEIAGYYADLLWIATFGAAATPCSCYVAAGLSIANIVASSLILGLGIAASDNGSDKKYAAGDFASWLITCKRRIKAG